MPSRTRVTLMRWKSTKATSRNEPGRKRNEARQAREALEEGGEVDPQVEGEVASMARPESNYAARRTLGVRAGREDLVPLLIQGQNSEACNALRTRGSLLATTLQHLSTGKKLFS